jgi:DNA-binding transcriptional MerR regulator
MSTSMRIGELSARTGASVRSVRYYEQQGLLKSERTANGQRIFSEEAVERITLIRRLFGAGLSSATMADLLPCITDPGARTPYLAERLRQERDRILEQVEQLGRTAQTLEVVIHELAEQ